MYVAHCSLRGYLVLGWGCKQKRYSNPLITRVIKLRDWEFWEVFFLFSKPSWGRDILKGKIISCYLYKNLCAGELAWKLQPWVASRSKEEGKRKGHTPSASSLHGGPSASGSASCSSVCTGAQSRCEVGPACWPRRACLLPAAKVFTINREDLALCRLPCKPSGSNSACGFRGSTFANPKAVHLEAKRSVQHAAPSLVSWTKQTVEWLLCVCFSLSQRDKQLLWLLVLKPLLHSPYLFLTFSVSGEFVI